MGLTIRYEYNYTEKVNGTFVPVMGKVIKTTGQTITIDSGPIRNNYIFLYWNTEDDDSGNTYYSGDTVSEDLTLYAIWKPITYLTTKTTLTSIANAIRANNGESTLYNFPEGFVNGISNINNKFIEYCNKELEVIELIKITSIPNYAFYRCSNLISINFPACISIGSSAFHTCFNLTSISFPICTSIRSYAFFSCSNLTSISFPACTSIENGAFEYCSNLTSIYLNNSSICSLSSSRAFYSTQITSTTGSIYVPVSLITEYQSAPEWSYFSARFFPIP